MGNLSNEEDIDQWSMSTEKAILTPATSEPGGSRDDESGGRTPVSHQRPWNETNPWPGTAYMIIKKTSGRAMTLKNGELFLATPDWPGQAVTQTAHNTWLCSEQSKYWSFQNRATGLYLGHNGGDKVHVEATRIQGWEMMIARPLPDGGYQLFMPFFSDALQVIAVSPNGRHLTRRVHGGAVWEFRMVQK